MEWVNFIYKKITIVSHIVVLNYIIIKECYLLLLYLFLLLDIYFYILINTFEISRCLFICFDWMVWYEIKFFNIFPKTDMSEQILNIYLIKLFLRVKFTWHFFIILKIF